MIAEAPIVLSQLLGLPTEYVARELSGGDKRGQRGDLTVEVGGYSFELDLIARPSAGNLRVHATKLRAAPKHGQQGTIATIVVPFMTEPLQRVCEDLCVSWFDLSGNARIVAPGLRVIVKGEPNKFRGPGRPESVFAPKSSRIVRWLLIHRGREVTQRGLATETELSEGYVSQILKRLEMDHYVDRRKAGSVHVRDPLLLLEAWRDEYRFSRNKVLHGHVAARSGDALTRLVSDVLNASSIPHAATAMSAAWQYQRFASFRIATFYLSGPPYAGLHNELGLQEDERGANLRLVLPQDPGVFEGARDEDGIRCVHPVQVYLDLKAHPERASEAADRIRSALRNEWMHDAS